MGLFVRYGFIKLYHYSLVVDKTESNCCRVQVTVKGDVSSSSRLLVFPFTVHDNSCYKYSKICEKMVVCDSRRDFKLTPLLGFVPTQAADLKWPKSCLAWAVLPATRLKTKRHFFVEVTRHICKIVFSEFLRI